MREVTWHGAYPCAVAACPRLNRRSSYRHRRKIHSPQHCRYRPFQNRGIPRCSRRKHRKHFLALPNGDAADGDDGALRCQGQEETIVLFPEIRDIEDSARVQKR